MKSTRRRRFLLRAAVALLVLLVAAAAGLYAAARLAPERLRETIESALAEASGGPCRLERLRVVPGLPLKLEGEGIDLWNGGLRIDRAVARVSIAEALLGRVHLSRLELEGAQLLLLWDGAPRPPWLEASGGDAAEPTSGAALLAAVAAAIEEVMGAILEDPVIANAVQVRDSRVVLDGALGSPVLALEIVQGEVFHSRLRGVSELAAQTRLSAGDWDRGSLEWHGARDRDGGLSLEVDASGLDLAWLVAGLEALPVRPTGSLSGTVAYRVPEGGRASADVSLVVDGFRWLAESGEAVSPPVRVTGSLRAALDDAHLEVTQAHFASEELSLDVHAVLAHPFDRNSNLGLSVRIGDIDLGRARAILSALPAPVGERAEAMTSALSGGRLAALGARGAATVKGWGDLLTGHAEKLPKNLTLEARLEGLDVELGEGELLEEVSAELLWKGDRLEVRNASARRAGVLLPGLSLELEGISHLFAADLSRRVPPSDEIRLPGMRQLLSLFEGGPGTEHQPPRARLEVERLEHPALLWPVESLELEVLPQEEGFVAEVRRFLWAQVPVRGEVRWTGDPEHLHFRFQLAAQSEPAAVAGAEPIEPPHVDPELAPNLAEESKGRVWGTGRFEIGPLESDVWRHEWLRGEFEMVRAEVRVPALEAQLAPRGHLEGWAALDLGDADALPFRAEFVARNLDAAALLAQAGLGQGFVTGNVDLRGKLEDRFERGSLPFVHLSGSLDIEARNGDVGQKLPALLALTLASESLDLTPSREKVRYDRVSIPLRISEGVVSTEAFELDGPDVRVFGSGTLDVARPPHRVDAELAVFLFRPVDRAIGAIPLLNTLLLGESDNLVAAYFELVGPWEKPVAEGKPMRTFTRGSMEVMKGVPRVVLRGIEMLGGMVGDEKPPPPNDAAEPESSP